MAKKMYAVQNGQLRKLRKGYTVIDRTVRKIRKGYTVIAGRIRPFWAGGELEYFGNSSDGAIEALGGRRKKMAAASVGKYVLFGGGVSDGNTGPEFSTVYVYDDDLTSHTSNLYSVVVYHAGSQTSEFAAFGGGKTGSNHNYYITGFTKTLTRFGTGKGRGKYYLSAAGVGEYVVFAGGASAGGATDENTVHSFNVEGTHAQVAAGLSEKKKHLCGVPFGKYAVFAGGVNGGSVVASADAYDEDLTQKRISSLSQARTDLAGASVGGRVLFLGGTQQQNYRVSAVDAYDENLTRSTLPNLPYYFAEMAGVSLQGYAIFGGGIAVSVSGSTGGYATPTVFSYNEDLTRKTEPNLSQSRYELSAGSAGDYALFAGGNIATVPSNSGSATDVVDVYRI